MMRDVGRSFPFVRASLVTALVGHWIANAVMDPIEYEAVGLRYSGEALVPILVQSALTVVVFGVLSWFANRRRHGPLPAWRLSQAALRIALVTSQLGLLWMLEASERLALGETFAPAFHGGLVDHTFFLELVVATLSAALLVALAGATTRLLRTFLRDPRPVRVASPLEVGVVDGPRRRAAPVMAGAGGERAPPSSIR